MSNLQKNIWWLAAMVVAAVTLWFSAFAPVDKEEAWSYKHIENSTIIYCDSDQGTPKDYSYLGKVSMPKDKILTCFLAQ